MSVGCPQSIVEISSEIGGQHTKMRFHQLVQQGPTGVTAQG